MNRINEVYEELKRLEKENKQGITAAEIGNSLNIDRSTSSRYLNELVRKNKVFKIEGKPVRYKTNATMKSSYLDKFDIRAGKSLIAILEKAMAAVMYPTKPLPILITGETGTGKTFMAETLAEIVNKTLGKNKHMPFISFNCADYAHNPELLVGQIFGVIKGAYTGANSDKFGLVERANNGILFLDEIHRLPPSGQEMLFYLIDKGIYRRLGESTTEHKATVALIGATTENPKEAILPTLYRRFTVKLEVPPLRERSREEREELVDQFLAEEAGKMNTNLSIVDSCKEVFLSYDYPGNIGQLKSEIQIACARAYLRYLKNEVDQVVITEDDLSSELFNFSKENIIYQEKIEKIETKSIRSKTDTNSFLLPNIYKQLNGIIKNEPNEISKEKIQKIIKSYVQELSKNYMQPHFATEKSWQQLMDQDLIHALERAYIQLKDQMPIYLNMNQLFVLGLHLQNYRAHGHLENKSLPTIVHPNVQYRVAARQIADVLEKTIGFYLPEEEVELIAFFLSPEQYVQTMAKQSIAVFLITHGQSTASSMAQVVNSLLGYDVIRAIDMPLNVLAKDIYERVKWEIKRLGNVNGVLLLVDIGSLITMGDTFQHEIELPIKTLSGVNLPMVIEAGRLSLVSDMTLSEIYEKTKRAMFTLINNEPQTNSMKKRMIATVCFTGEGAAQLLETWIKSQLSEIDQDVVVLTVRIDPTTKDTTVLNDLNNYYKIVAIIGTVPVSIEGIPYIPAWELLQSEGITRMKKLLEITRNSSGFIEKDDIQENEIPQLILRGLSEIVTYVNPKIITTILEEYMPQIRSYFKWDNMRELGMWMHMGSLMDRIISAKMNNTLEKLIESIPFNTKLNITKDERKVWTPLIEKFETEFEIEIPNKVVEELVKLSR